MLRSVEPGPEGEVLPFYARFPLSRFAPRFNHGLHRGLNVVISILYQILSDIEISLGNRVDRKKNVDVSNIFYDRHDCISIVVIASCIVSQRNNLIIYRI